ncbi:hypothetical protein BDF14DRAFT_1764447 [Spinellus fusiger]|nr:hypothetical protein BDF14DRAFT_1764447 [Spinellus fusiger]
MLCRQQDVNETDEEPIASYSSANPSRRMTVKEKDMRRMLKKEGFKLYLINEFKTSSLCPECNYSPLETFKHVKNPMSY